MISVLSERAISFAERASQLFCCLHSGCQSRDSDALRKWCIDMTLNSNLVGNYFKAIVIRLSLHNLQNTKFETNNM